VVAADTNKVVRTISPARHLSNLEKDTTVVVEAMAEREAPVDTAVDKDTKEEVVVVAMVEEDSNHTEVNPEAVVVDGIRLPDWSLIWQSARCPRFLFPDTKDPPGTSIRRRKISALTVYQQWKRASMIPFDHGRLLFTISN
jgi:hypothetical protein